MNIPDHISEGLNNNFWVKILKFFDVDPVSGMENIRIRDPSWKAVGSGIRAGKKSGVGDLIFKLCFSDFFSCSVRQY